MDEQALHTKLAEILEELREIPAENPQLDLDSEASAENEAALLENYRETLREVAKREADRRERLQRAVKELQDSLDYLRLTVKYLIFDLEATRRENGYLRKMVEAANREPKRRDDDEEETPGFDSEA